MTAVTSLQTLYGGRSKDQRGGFTKVPTGSSGTLKHVYPPDDYGTCALYLFVVGGKRLWVKCSPTCVSTCG